VADAKIGAYICKGCGLGERLNTAQLATIATREGKVAIAKEHEFLCNAAGVAMIKEDIEKEGVNRVVIAACSRRARPTRSPSIPPRSRASTCAKA